MERKYRLVLLGPYISDKFMPYRTVIGYINIIDYYVPLEKS